MNIYYGRTGLEWENEIITYLRGVIARESPITLSLSLMKIDPWSGLVE